MITNYSKGEWIPYQGKSNNVSICVKSSDKEVVVVEVASLNTLLGYDTVLANACLIAAAPAMYEALKETWAYLAPLCHHSNIKVLCDKIGVALAKAEGKANG